MRRAAVVLAMLALAAVATALLAPGSRAGGNPKLFGTVTSNAVISMRDAAGNPVTHIDPGTFDVVIADTADEHNFHLSGPGFDQFTDVEGTANLTWTVTFRDGSYRFNCDPHASTMRGSFTVGNPPPPPPPPPPPTTKPPTKLTGTVGPGYAIALRNGAGARVKTLKAGRYAITVRDRASTHNFHLVGPGVNRKTGVAFKGTAKPWTVTLRKGTLRWLCDPHKTRLSGSARVG